VNDAKARELLAALAVDAISPQERAQLQAYLAQRPHLQQELQATQSLFQRIEHGSATPPPEAWSAIEAAIARDVTDAEAPRIPAPVQSGRWREGSARSQRPAAARALGYAAEGTPESRADLLFGKIALNRHLLSRDLLQRALQYQRAQAPHLRLGEILLERGILTRDQVNEVLAYQEQISGLMRSPSPAPEAFAAPSAFAPGLMAGPPRVDVTASGAPGFALVSDPGDSAEDEDSLLGTVIDGCTLQTKIGQGGMGSIYLAHHESLRVDVVVKILSPDSSNNPRTVERFHREARSAARLEHPNVVGVRDVGTTAAGLHYIIMQYVSGGSLEEKIRDEGKHELGDALRILLKISSALEAAHSSGVIHRDLKPDNVLVSSSGEVYVADFGLAKDLNSELKLTADGAMIGTPLYMAPEIGRVKEIDGRVDIFSLGVTFYYLLTGIQPFRGFTALDILSAKAHDKIKPPEAHLPEISADTRAVLGKMLAKDRDRRYSDISELVGDLERLDRGLPVEADPSAGPWGDFASLAGAGGSQGAEGGGKPSRPALLAGLVVMFFVVGGLLAWLVSLLS
jgi:tRNA A-37 threonylcarbamoyl transferase component Bud32